MRIVRVHAFLVIPLYMETNYAQFYNFMYFFSYIGMCLY
ncbi:hypothetical protein Maes01_02526 [Microbulbifer aestuariivivens]|uniref:Uncharacterized protein n=1 Tax=Microbulbifer aestuariivivens TaxID=1908308 RepID=A0ABP9WRX0_9GAMM